MNLRMVPGDKNYVSGHRTVYADNPLAIIIGIILLLLFALLTIYTVTQRNKYSTQNNAQAQTLTQNSQIYWGAYIDASYYHTTDYNVAIDIFESHAGKRISLYTMPEAWYNAGSYRSFEAGVADLLRNRGIIPIVDWRSWDLSLGGSTNQPMFTLASIINGNHDTFIHQYAHAIATWGHPLFMRFDTEMNGNWYNYSEVTNGNSQGQFVSAWRHVHDIFVQEGATNATWVWSVSTKFPELPYSSQFSELYPGDNYVDWVAIDGYNWSYAHSDPWKTFSEVFSPTYSDFTTLFPSKPIMITEHASDDRNQDGSPGPKDQWITDELSTQLPVNFPQIQAIVWFNWNVDNAHWVIEQPSAAQSAFAQGIGSSYFAANDFTAISQSPIIPLSGTLSPQPTQAISPTTVNTPIPPSPTPTGDTTAPTVSITYPISGAIVTRNTIISIQATASDNVGVAQVRFYVGGSLKCTDFTAPYSCTWKVPGAVNKTYAIQVSAYDVANNSSSQTISISSSR